ncbi:MAG: hypothetical protein EAZ85_15595 [Bacteroidetes bacterium]|nr:MAG: hypothetical protein EAZ85_15595 [Bacteroidota bacterium]TAG85170.1 MAG: hypothetical protein EAZ20_15890 [Bacteroidota bacterium]
MKKIILSLISYFFFSSPIFAQKNVGSAAKLEGNVYVLSIFIATSDDDWTKKEKELMYEKQRIATNWLVKKAKEYKKKLAFVEGTFGYDKSVFVEEIPQANATGNERTDWIKFLLNKLGYKSPLQFHNWVLKNTKCTQSVVLIYANQTGNSYAFPYTANLDKEKYFVEGCFLYKKFTDGQIIYPSTIAHEMLHDFGAWDLYKNFMQGQDKEDKAKQLYPNEIMLRIALNINELEINGLTAWLVGLTEKKEKWYEWFKPDGY